MYRKLARAAAALAPGIAFTLCAFADATTDAFPRAMTIEGCPNVFAMSDQLISGGAPESDAAFKALADAGVKTIISVDGAKPDVDRAASFGLRYVHIPIGYDGVPRERSLEIARAVRDLPGKVYIHCHHGKHRSPAAAASVMVCSQGWTPDRAVAYMKLAGTAPSYTGLYSDVQNAKPASASELDRADHSFPAVSKVPDFVDTMVVLEERFDALTESKAAGWTSPAGSPDIAPAHDALQLLELIKESQRTGLSSHSEPDFSQWMEGAEKAATTLETALRENSSTLADASYAALKQSCADCHGKYRNVPQHPRSTGSE